MKGSASGPSSATMKGTRWAIRPEMKAISRERRSSFETITGHLAALASARRPAVECIGAFARFRFHVFSQEPDLLGFGKSRDRGALRFDAQARAVLLLCGDTIVGNSAFHTNCIPPFALCMNSISEQSNCCFCCCSSEQDRSRAVL